MFPRPSRRDTKVLAPSSRRESERGQLLTIFALALVALLAMVGVIIDGGDTFLQRRDQQNVADAAAMAAGYATVNGADPTTVARTVAAANGYVHGANNTTVNVTVSPTIVTVDVSRPHRNYFSGIVGFSSWDVATTATVEAGIPNGAYGAMPIIFNDDAYHDPTNRNPLAPGVFDEPGTGSNDVPQGDSQFNWTVYCTASGSEGCNADSATVEALINNEGTSTTVFLDDTIAPLNAGSHTTLFSDLANQVGQAFPVAIVDDDGDMLGWAWFHITGSVGGSNKQISGWFEEGVNAPPMTIVQGHGNGATFGPWVVDLID